MIKRMFAIALALSILFMFTACQSTPEEEIVVQKDQDRMVEAASSTDGNSEDVSLSLSEQVLAPETYTGSFTGSDGLLIINVDAAVSVPDADTIPIYRVYSGGFSEEFADKVYQLFCGDTDMYAASESYTKDAIMEEILEQQQILASGDLDEEARSGTEAYIAQLQQEYQTAPDTMGTPVTSVTFNTKQEYGASYTVFEVRENEAGNGGKTFSVKNDVEYDTEELQTVDGETVAPRSNAHLGYSDVDIRPSENMYEVREVLGEEQVDELNTTPIQAQAMVEDLLDKIGVDDMKIYSICLMTDTPGSSDANAKYGYNVKLCRTVDGICVNSPDYCTFVDDPSYSFQWNYETFTISLSDDGIYSFEWNAPLEISEVVVEDSTLLSFDKIMDVFENMICIANEPEALIAERYSSIEFVITEITLSLQRISEQNSITSGLLVPVWNFYGEKIITYKDGTISSLSEELNYAPDAASLHYPFLSINAVDGSIIDTSKGY